MASGFGFGFAIGFGFGSGSAVVGVVVVALPVPVPGSVAASFGLPILFQPPPRSINQVNSITLNQIELQLN